MRTAAARARVTVVDGEAVTARREQIATEEPLAIRAAGPGQEPVDVAVTMRTPGSDQELAAGFLFTEALIGSREEVATIRYCDPDGPAEQRYNVVTVHLRRPFDAGALRRNFYATSSCGVCGKASLDQIEVACRELAPGPQVPAAVIAGLPASARAAQSVFTATGGTHAAALFTAGGALIVLREDVGRHNALDKVIGHALLEGMVPVGEAVAFVSGRASFELVQKAAVAAIPVLCAVSAPSSLALAAARRLGMTLIGFTRDGRFTVYTNAERVSLSSTRRLEAARLGARRA
ncbi:MAG: formate dehydrogenase accessory sulfurtransferase FdhD [Thermoleophilia bacterium]|nr:formate dehydrogenase accessory sulfurtransferase FdhD [Thermoleophilia bacterium]